MDEHAMEDLVMVLVLAAKHIEREANCTANITSWKPIRFIDLARYNYEVASSKEDVAKCDSWLRIYKRIVKCGACDGNGIVEKQRTSGGCDNLHWGDCTNDCLPHTWTECLSCGECNGSGKTKSVMSVLG